MQLKHFHYPQESSILEPNEKRMSFTAKVLYREEIYLSEISSVKEFIKIREEWKNLFIKSSNATPFQSWEWNYAMINELSSSEKIKVIAGYNKKREIVGIAPFQLTSKVFPHIKILEFIGCRKSDYLDFIVNEEYRYTFTKALFDLLKKSKDWTILNLVSLREETKNLIERYLPVEISQQEVCPCTYLPDTFNEYEKEVHKRELDSIKRQLRKLLPQNRLTYIASGSPENLTDNVNSFIELHQKRHKSKGERGKFCTKASKKSFHDMSKLMCEAGMLRIEILKIDSVLASINFILVLNNKKYNYLSGMNPAFSNFKPGKLLIYYMMEDAIKKGYKVFDFLQGAEDYKYFWTNKEIQLFSAVYSRSRISSLLLKNTRTLRNQLLSSHILKKSYQIFYHIFQSGLNGVLSSD